MSFYESYSDSDLSITDSIVSSCSQNKSRTKKLQAKFCYFNLEQQFHQYLCYSDCLCDGFFIDEDYYDFEINKSYDEIWVKNQVRNEKYFYKLSDNKCVIYQIFINNDKNPKILITFNFFPEVIKEFKICQNVICSNFKKYFNNYGNLFSLDNKIRGILLESNDFEYGKLSNSDVKNLFLTNNNFKKLGVLEKLIENINEKIMSFDFDEIFKIVSYDKFFEMHLLTNESYKKIKNSNLTDMESLETYLVNSNSISYNIFSILSLLIFRIKNIRFKNIINNALESKVFVNNSSSLNNNFYKSKIGEHSHSEKYFDLKQIIIYPQYISLRSKNKIHENRFLRKYFDDDNFIRISFKNNMSMKLQTNTKKFYPLEEIFHVVKDQGINILNRHYEFFFFTTSNLKTNSIWFIDSNSFKSKKFNSLKINCKEELYLDMGLRLICPLYKIFEFLSNPCNISEENKNPLEILNDKRIHDKHVKIKKNPFEYKSNPLYYDYNGYQIQKIISCISLNFSSTIEFYIPGCNGGSIGNKEVIDIEYEDDIGVLFGENNKKSSIFTDGCGKISTQLLNKICESFYKKVKSCAVQIRYNGIKGVLIEFDEIRGDKIIFTESMVKFKGDLNNKIEIIMFSRFLKGMLNLQIIIILVLRKFKIGFFLKLLKKKKMQILNGEEKLFHKILKNFNGKFNYKENKKNKTNFNCVSNENCNNHYDNMNNNFLLYYKFNELFCKFKIRLKKSCYLMGVVDFYGILEEDQIFIQISNSNEKSKVIHSEVLIMKNPVYSVNDIRLVKPIKNQKLESMYKNVVVFPSKGRHSLPSLLSNSDLDGDFYFIIYQKEFIKTFKQTKKFFDMKNKKEIYKYSEQKIYQPINLNEYNWTKNFICDDKNYYCESKEIVYIPRNRKPDSCHQVDIETIKFQTFEDLSFEDNIFEYFLFYNRFQKISYINDKYTQNVISKLTHKDMILDSKNGEYSDVQLSILEENFLFEIKANIEVDFAKKGITLNICKEEDEKIFEKDKVKNKSKFSLICKKSKQLDYKEVFEILQNFQKIFLSYKSFIGYEILEQGNLELNLEKYKTRGIIDIRDIIFPIKLRIDKNSIFSKAENFAGYLVDFFTIENKNHLLLLEIFKKEKYRNKFLNENEIKRKNKIYCNTNYGDLIVQCLNERNLISELAILNSFVSSILSFLDSENFIIRLKSKEKIDSNKFIEFLKKNKGNSSIKNFIEELIKIQIEYEYKVKEIMINNKFMFENEITHIRLLYPSLNQLNLNTDHFDWRKNIKFLINNLNDFSYNAIENAKLNISLEINEIQEMEFLSLFKSVIFDHEILLNIEEKYIYLSHDVTSQNYVTDKAKRFLNDIINNKNLSFEMKYDRFIRETKIFGLLIYYIERKDI